MGERRTNPWKSKENILPCGHSNCRFQFQKRSQHFIGAHNETLSIVALSGFLEGSALGPFVKVGALTRQRFRITRNTSWRTILVRALDFPQCSFDRALLPIVTLTALPGELTRGISSRAIVFL